MSQDQIPAVFIIHRPNMIPSMQTLKAAQLSSMLARRDVINPEIEAIHVCIPLCTLTCGLHDALLQRAVRDSCRDLKARLQHTEVSEFESFPDRRCLIRA
jgi:hypothetical protein